MKELDIIGRKKIVAKYPKLWTTVEPILQTFPSLSMMKSGLSHEYNLLGKQKNFKHRTCWFVTQTQKPAA